MLLELNAETRALFEIMRGMRGYPEDRPRIGVLVNSKNFYWRKYKHFWKEIKWRIN